MTPLLLAAALALGGPAGAQAPQTGVQAAAVPGGMAEPPANPPPSPEEAKRLKYEIGRGLRCPVCQGLSVADSNADSAQTMYRRIGELVALGYDQQQIEDYFVERYGEWVLLAPPAEGLHWVIWLGPIVAFVVGAGLIGLRARADARAPAPAPAGGTDLPAGESDPYRQRILAELDGGPPAEGA